VIVKCTSCGSRYRVSDDLVADGPKRFKCKNCGAVLVIKPPAAVAEKPAPKPEAPKAEPAPPKAEAAPGPAEEPAGADVQDEKEAPAAEQPAAGDGDEGAGDEAAATDDEQPSEEGEEGESQEEEQENQGAGQAILDASGLSPEELAAQQQQDIQEKLEKRRQQMEDEISGRLNKAALETLDVDVLSELANKIEEIQHNQDFHAEPETKLFACIKCKAIFSIYPDDPRVCANCPGEVSLVRAEDILKQFGMFG